MKERQTIFTKKKSFIKTPVQEEYKKDYDDYDYEECDDEIDKDSFDKVYRKYYQE